MLSTLEQRSGPVAKGFILLSKVEFPGLNLNTSFVLLKLSLSLICRFWVADEDITFGVVWIVYLLLTDSRFKLGDLWFKLFEILSFGDV